MKSNNYTKIEQRHKVAPSPHKSDMQFRDAFEHAPIGKALIGLDGRLIEVNPALCEIVGYSATELVNMDITAITYNEDQNAGFQQVRRLLAGKIRSYQIEKRYRHRDGRPVWTRLSVTLVRSDAGAPDYFIAQIVDIDQHKRTEKALLEIKSELEARVKARTEELATVNRQLKESNARLRSLVRTDSLTGLYNRWELMRRLEQQLHESQRYATEWCLMLIDIDHFKKINDRNGHVVGDRALEAFARVVRQHTRDTDFAARYGGDEFCVLVPHSDKLQAGQLAENLLKALQTLKLKNVEGERVDFSCSIGIVQWKPSLDTVEKLIDAADARLYAAKNGGRSRVEGVFDEAAD